MWIQCVLQSAQFSIAKEELIKLNKKKNKKKQPNRKLFDDIQMEMEMETLKFIIQSERVLAQEKRNDEMKKWRQKKE